MGGCNERVGAIKSVVACHRLRLFILQNMASADIYTEALRATEQLKSFDEGVIEKFARLMQLLEKANAVMNLTTVRAPADVALLHFADSLAALEAEPALRTARRGADIGAGAGFPLLPLAITLPECNWVGVESIGKKSMFIRSAADEQEIQNVETFCGRAEEIGRLPEHREQHDVVTARAVGSVAALCEVGLPLLKVGGKLLLYKNEQALAELESSKGVIDMLGGTVEEPYAYKFDRDIHRRLIMRILKVKGTDQKYPRPAGVPFKKPILAGKA